MQQTYIFSEFTQLHNVIFIVAYFLLGVGYAG